MLHRRMFTLLVALFLGLIACESTKYTDEKGIDAHTYFPQGVGFSWVYSVNRISGDSVETIDTLFCSYVDTIVLKART